MGWPETLPDHVSLWGSLLQIRRAFDQYVNLRPARLFAGVPCPLAGRAPGDIDLVIVRENTEGEYSSVGGRMFEGTERELVMQETIMTRHGVDRILRFAFETARARPRKRLTSATKSNGLAITMPYWDERFAEMARNYPDVWSTSSTSTFSPRISCSSLTRSTSSSGQLFGDILSDLAPACTGTIGIAPSGNINPERDFPSLFEPVHGSAPDIAGKGVANPIGQIWAASLMLEHLGEAEAAAAIMRAIELSLLDPAKRTRDLAGSASTLSAGSAIAALLD